MLHPVYGGSAARAFDAFEVPGMAVVFVFVYSGREIGRGAPFEAVAAAREQAVAVHGFSPMARVCIYRLVKRLLAEIFLFTREKRYGFPSFPGGLGPPVRVGHPASLYNCSVLCIDWQYCGGGG